MNEYLKIAQKYLDQAIALPNDIVEAIKSVYAGTIASTVGIELLLLGKRLAQIEIPGYGYVFDYDQDPDMLKIPLREVLIWLFWKQKRLKMAIFRVTFFGKEIQ